MWVFYNERPYSVYNNSEKLPNVTHIFKQNISKSLPFINPPTIYV